MLSRLSTLAARPRHTLAALAVVLAAVGVAVGSGANFTAHVATAQNTFATGSLSIDTPTAAILTADHMVPGDTVQGVVDVRNSGDVAGDFSLSPSGATGDVDLLDQLDLVITHCGAYTSTPPDCLTGTSVYSGPVSGASGALGTFPAGEKHRYKFVATLPSSTDNTYQGKAASIVFNWNAVAGH